MNRREEALLLSYLPLRASVCDARADHEQNKCGQRYQDPATNHLVPPEVLERSDFLLHFFFGPNALSGRWVSRSVSNSPNESSERGVTAKSKESGVEIDQFEEFWFRSSRCELPSSLALLDLIRRVSSARESRDPGPFSPRGRVAVRSRN